VDLIERLLAAADGGPAVYVDGYDASTLVALLSDAAYRRAVLGRVDGMA
jgi:hypothetical protein